MLGNPNNPTGTLEPPENVLALARPGRMLLVDESFIDFVASPQASVAGLRTFPDLIVVRSLTKLWSLAGIRAGYLLAAAPVVERLRRRPPAVERQQRSHAPPWRGVPATRRHRVEWPASWRPPATR